MRIVTYEKFFDNKTYCILEHVNFFTDGTTNSESAYCHPFRIVPESIAERRWNYIFRYVTAGL